MSDESNMPFGWEVRRNEDGTLDEFVAEKVAYVALEQLSERCWQLRVVGKKDAVHVAIYAERAHVKTMLEVNP